MGTIKSRPVYQTLRIDPTGRTHLLVTDLTAVPETAFETFVQRSDIETWIVGLQAPGIAIAGAGSTRAFRATADLLWHLSHRLARECVGLRLYAVGGEAFLWDVMNLARAAGMGGEEVFLTHSGTWRRRVYCSHCKTMNEDVATNTVACRGCGANLLVRDHFSRRLAAFMGVKVDAENPGEAPEIALVYP